MKSSTVRATVLTHECGWSSKATTPALAAHALRAHSCEKQDALNAARSRGAVRKAAVDGEPKPCLHKQANHQHGTRACAVLDGCKCAPCSAANSAAERDRQRQIAYGRWHPYVDAQPTREHVDRLRAAGMGLKQVAKVSGVAHGVLSKLMYGERGMNPSRRIRYETAVRLQVVQAGAAVLADGAKVSNAGTRRRLQALVTVGWSQSKLAARLGMHPGNFHKLMHCNDAVFARTARAVAALYDELWNQPPPHGNHRDKIAYSRSVTYAAQHDWAGPGAWLGINIDDPAAHPNATGYDEDRVAAVMAGALLDGDADLDLALTRADRLEILRRGHLAFKGHSMPQIAQRVGVRVALFRSDIAAERNGTRQDASGELDDVAVERIMSGTLQLPEHARSPERVEAVRRLAGQGLNDADIGARTGLSHTYVTQLRLRNNIPSPLTALEATAS